MRVVAPPTFRYERPQTLGDALEALGSEDGALALAGGTDLVSLRASGLLEPTLLVDIKRVPELAGIVREGQSTRIGACATMRELSAAREPQLAAVRDGAAVVGAPQTRHRATLGGNVCRSSPAGDTLPPLLVLDAIAVLRSERETRRVPLREFFRGPGENAMRSDELLVSLDLAPVRGASAYARVTYRAWMDLAVVGVAVRLAFVDQACVDAAVAVGGVAPVPLLVPDAARALIGGGVDEAAIGAARDAAVAAANPIDDVRGSREYRLRALGVQVERVTRLARARALSEAEHGGDAVR